LPICATLVAIDGDTISCDGVNMRDMGNERWAPENLGLPETHNAECQHELELGRAATAA